MIQDWSFRAGAICMHCGGRCCNEAHPPISGYCYQRLISLGVPEDSFEWRGYRAVRARGDSTCIFSAESRQCSIQSIKPETCRAGPFTFDVKGDVIEIFLKYATLCPVVRLLEEVPEAYDHQFALAKKSITRLVANLTDEELSAICRIEEPKTGKVAEIPREYPVHDHRH
jgi:Fe-S-cluster containining protein